MWTQRLAVRIFARAALLLFAAAPACAAGTGLRPGQYLWHPQVAPEGPLVVVVSLDEQRLYVYRNGVAIGYSTISSGRRGHETPSGVFTILQKDRDHRSNRYDDAPMPYMERLTWDGVAMHGGTLPGYPASHGCVRLPHDFAERLFAITRRGDTVVVASGAASPVAIVHPSVLAPVTPSGLPADLRDRAHSAWAWDESAAPPGPLSLVVSTPDRRVHVLRSGIRIGTSRIDVAEGFDFSGAVVFVRLREAGTTASALAAPRWAMYRLRGEAAPTMDELAAKLKVPDEFAARVEAALAPGTSILVVDRPATGMADAAGAAQPVLESETVRDGKLDVSR
ncbi:L,D-transpeptidase [Dokdonella ginsengisoli]|uniref:L,D-transpeptidase n=1 Tax=Dokdonella ginsengisoli TaxID=363846 RepID=A0ABV9QZE7_9GAMM